MDTNDFHEENVNRDEAGRFSNKDHPEAQGGIDALNNNVGERADDTPYRAFDLDDDAYVIDLDDVPAGTFPDDVAKIVVKSEHDYDAQPEDYECYDEEDIEAWRNNEWEYRTVTVEVTTTDGRTGEAVLGGNEFGFNGERDEKTVWRLLNENGMVDEALFDAQDATPNAELAEEVAEEVADKRAAKEAAAARRAEYEAREKMRREDPDGYKQVVDAEKYEHAAGHWGSVNRDGIMSANEKRAVDVITRMEGVDTVTFDEGINPVRAGHGGYGKTGTVTYKGKQFPIEVYEGVGTISGTGYISVKNDDGREIAAASYSIPKTEGGYARIDRDNLGENIEEAIMGARMVQAIRDANLPLDGSAMTLRNRVRTSGGKVWMILPGAHYGESDLYFHGGRTWRGHGGSAYGSKAQQQEAVVRALGGGNLAQGKKVLAQLNEVMAQVQAEHDREFPPTAKQTSRRRRI